MKAWRCTKNRFIHVVFVVVSQYFFLVVIVWHYFRHLNRVKLALWGVVAIFVAFS